MAKRFSWPGMFVLAATLVAAPRPTGVAAQGQNDNKNTVSFQTIDEVTIVGTFYKGPKGTESPTAILIHKFGSDRTKGGWDALALALQEKLGFAVLTFDLRGHGQSKVVKDRFWDRQYNKAGIRGGFNSKNKSEINFSEFHGSYWPILFNDLMAARFYLDQENDAQRCSTSSIVVIGAEDGAGLGMGWIAEEWDRRLYVGAAGVLGTPISNRIAGEDMAAGVWLGPVQRSKMTFKTNEWFSTSPGASRLREGTPMYFLYGKQDSNSAGAVTGMFNAVKKPADGQIKKPHSLDKEEALATKLPGQELLGNAPLGVTDKVVKYLEEVMKRRGNTAWKRQDPRPLDLFPLAKYNYLPPT